jgi:hypothetical protein
VVAEWRGVGGLVVNGVWTGRYDVHVDDLLVQPAAKPVVPTQRNQSPSQIVIKTRETE